MSKVWVKRQGRVATVFLDDGGQSMPLRSFDDVPMGFPFTESVQSVQAKYAGREIIWVDRPSQEQPEAPEVDDAALQRLAGGVNPPSETADDASSTAPWNAFGSRSSRRVQSSCS
jgi:hypothetical protein